MKRLTAACAFLAALCACGAAPAAEPRIALVIGNSAYGAKPLPNPARDARAVAAVLTRLGFEVILRENARLADLIDIFGDFAARSRRYPVRLVYYAGHGVQANGRNYMIPVDADIRADEEVRYKGADIGELIDRLAERHDGLNIVILDACRNNPYPAVLRGDTGLAGIAAPQLPLRLRTRLRGATGPMEPKGTVIAYATAPGAIAYDGDSANSLYTRALLANIETPGLPLELMFKRVRQTVVQQTREAQIPWENSSLVGDFCFAPGQAGLCSADTLTAGGNAR